MIFGLKKPRAFFAIALMVEACLYSTHVSATDLSPGLDVNRSEAVNPPTAPSGNPEAVRGMSILRLVNDSDVALELRAANASSWADNPIRETGLVVTSPNPLEPGDNKLLEATGLGSTIETYLWLCEPVASKDPPAEPVAFPLLAPQRGLIATDTQTGVVPSWPNQELLTNQQHAASCMVPTGKIMNGKDPLQELSNCGSPPAEPGVYLKAITTTIPHRSSYGSNSIDQPKPTPSSTKRWMDT